MREKRRPPWQGDVMTNFTDKSYPIGRKFYLKGKDGSFEGNECSPEREASSAEREVKTNNNYLYVLLKHVAKSRYHVLLEMYNESLEEPKEASGIITPSNITLLIVIRITIVIIVIYGHCHCIYFNIRQAIVAAAAMTTMTTTAASCETGSTSVS